MGCVNQGERGERRRDQGHEKSYNAVDRFFHPANTRQGFARTSSFVAHCLPSSPARASIGHMSDSQVDFSVPATLRKWPSLNKQRVGASLGARPYMIGEGGTLDECIRQFMQLPEAQRHLYEIHTAPQADLVSAILSAEHVVELARLRDFLGK
jgi:hypothetical protein